MLLVGTAVLYLWGLGESGWANSFYSAAAQAGSESWKAFFFGSSDAANSITVDKTPLPVADGPVGAALRAVLVEHPRAPGPDGRRAVSRCSTRRSDVRRAPRGAGLLAGRGRWR